MYYRCVRFNTNHKKNQVRNTILKEQKELSVLKNGTPDCPVCHQIVSGAPGPYSCQPATLGKTKTCSAIICRSVQCATGLSGEPAEQWLSARNGRLCQMNIVATVQRRSQRGTKLSGAARGQSLQKSTSSEP
jgi:hypothetical protein